MWKKLLDYKLASLGENPSQGQLDALESWIINNVPRSYWSAIAPILPDYLIIQFHMRAAEVGA